MNNTERWEWVQNDEGLYNLWIRRPKVRVGIRLEKQSKSEFLKENRGLIDEVVGNVTGSRRPAHYLAYPGRGW